ncbi:hypothetical protein SAMN05216389_11857 [Oceanobacillus limi]|uniref:Uncharacterized protein n=1 Tax=Oceanobacillus limi TaxID=930131 RepID=A0A1I0G245_9BACI|nr:hypothetical protein [Oceanobacillus limi]SET64659.1 hypothetical protein SAMN05216389_11857 [Oceanobacillus limi]
MYSAYQVPSYPVAPHGQQPQPMLVLFQPELTSLKSTLTKKDAEFLSLWFHLNQKC